MTQVALRRKVPITLLVFDGNQPYTNWGPARCPTVLLECGDSSPLFVGFKRI